MRVQTKLYLFFAALLPAGFFAGLILYLRFGIRLSGADPVIPETGLFPEMLLRYYYLIRIPLLIFCSGFTVFAPFVSSVSVLYIGTLLGGAVCAGQAGGTACGLPGILILPLFLTLTVLLGGQAAAHRNFLRSAAPRASVLAHSPESRGYVTCFMTVSALLLPAALLGTLFPGLIFLF